MSTLVCNNVRRRENVRQHHQLNGLDYLEVGSISEGSSQTILTVHFLGKAPVELTKANVLIEGGQRIRDIKVETVEVQTSESADFDDLMIVRVDKSGDFSNYTLRVVEKNDSGEIQKHSQFDPRYDSVEFNFKVDCPNDLDCKQEVICPPETMPEPDINYLAKDYASFRQLLLDRLSLLMPEWQERHIPDIGITLVEVLAYTADHLSYYQDAVATEAYLDTARQRVSVRRHARLVDYIMHQGCNARVWLCLAVSDMLTFPADEQIKFITGTNESLQVKTSIVSVDEFTKIPQSRYEVFEPVSNEDIVLYPAHNVLNFYTWGDQECCIAKGATSATLIGEWIPPQSDDPQHCKPLPPDCEDDNEDNQKIHAKAVTKKSAIELHLKPGDVLILEERIGSETGHPQDANPKHRHAVKLTEVSGDVDPLTGLALTHISWHSEDALPFPLCLSALGAAPDCRMLKNISVACGNVVLLDHGCSVEQTLPDVPKGEVIECCKKEGFAVERHSISPSYTPKLEYSPLTYCEAVDENKAASQILIQNVRNATPKIVLNSENKHQAKHQWQVKQDLLSSQAYDCHFVTELNDSGHAYLRFGNNDLGQQVESETKFNSKYRIGNGKVGNVGAETITHVYFTKSSFDGVSISLRNPMPAIGGQDAESVTDVKLFAPHAFSKEIQRAIIAEDYVEIVLREFGGKVQNAYAKLRWTGSWYEVLVAIDPFGKELAEQSLLDEISSRLHRYRRMGHDLVVRAAVRVPLEIEIKICVLPNYLRGHVKAELLKVFSNKRLVNGKLGFFHPDELTFGEDIYLSKLVTTAQCIEGVMSVEVCKLQRWCEKPNKEIENGVLPLSNFEIARLDNDANFPENGILSFELRGGR